ncbi:MAG: hypothetical protein IT463_02440 [Planctomycetes bacterium]|nr:hypothetical protein [Planctomycetota bacterium]
MEYEVTVDGQKFRVRFFERDGQLHVQHEGGTFPVQADTPLRSKVQLARLDGEAARFGYHRGKEAISVVLGGAIYEAEVREQQHVRFTQLAPRKGAGTAIDVKAPMPGMVVTVRVKPGQAVKKNESLLGLHAMKLENDIRAPRDGVVQGVFVKAGDVLEKGVLMVRLGPPQP